MANDSDSIDDFDVNMLIYVARGIHFVHSCSSTSRTLFFFGLGATTSGSASSSAYGGNILLLVSLI
jgi:hypothetical protein